MKQPMNIARWFRIAAILLFAALAAAAGLVAASIETEKKELAAAMRHDVAWSAANGRFEVAQLERHLARYALTRSAEHRDSALLFREIVEGRIETWSSGEFGMLVDSEPKLADRLESVKDAFAAAGPILDRFLAGASGDDTEMREILVSTLAAIEEPTRRIATLAYTTSVREMARIREALDARQRTLFLLVKAMLATGVVLLVLGYVQNRSLSRAEQQAREEALQSSYLADHDPLTGLANRKRLYELVRGFAHGEAVQAGFGILALDLDGFKAINDTLGHAAGDQLLRQVAERLRDLAARHDHETVVARLGGDEFVVLLGTTDTIEEASSFAADVSRTIKDPYILALGRVEIGVTIGVAVSGIEEAGDASLVWENADLALTRAKAAGRGTILTFTGEMREAAARERVVERDLREAIANGDVFPLFQPQIDLATGRLASVEALARWRHPTDGWISPAAFIPRAEASGQIVALGLAILESACTQVARGLPAHTGVSVNLSVVQMRLEDLPERIADILERSGLPPDRLTLEVTESTLLHDEDRAVAMLDRLKALGIRLALDDFGTGYSALSYLELASFDEIKLDRSLVSGISTCSRKRAIVEAVARLSRRLGMEVVAEGIETVTDAICVREIGCRLGQGFLYGPALPIDALPRRIDSPPADGAVDCPLAPDTDRMADGPGRSAITDKRYIAHLSTAVTPVSPPTESRASA